MNIYIYKYISFLYGTKGGSSVIQVNIKYLFDTVYYTDICSFFVMNNKCFSIPSDNAFKVNRCGLHI